VTDDEVDDYVRYLHERLPSGYAHLSVDAVRAVLDAEADYYQRRFGPIHGWRALLREMFGRGHPPPAAVDAALPEFEQYVLTALNADERYGALISDDIRAVMRVEGEAGPDWTPPAPPSMEQSEDTTEMEQSEDTTE
jgi:hypothetical protein